MFTLKLYTMPNPNEGRVKIVEVERFVLYRYDNGSTQISTWPAGETHYVGAPDHATADDERYDHAIIENASGRTTEIVRQVPMNLPVRQDRRQNDLAASGSWMS